MSSASAAASSAWWNLGPAGYLLLAERLTLRQWIGAGIVVVAVGAATLIRKNDRPAN